MGKDKGNTSERPSSPAAQRSPRHNARGSMERVAAWWTGVLQSLRQKKKSGLPPQSCWRRGKLKTFQQHVEVFSSVGCTSVESKLIPVPVWLCGSTRACKYRDHCRHKQRAGNVLMPVFGRPAKKKIVPPLVFDPLAFCQPHGYTVVQGTSIRIQP